MSPLDTLILTTGTCGLLIQRMIYAAGYENGF